jgi:hypothetical protein
VAVAAGRNFYEVLRCLDSLQLALHSKVHTPVHWVIGEATFVDESVTDEEAAVLFPGCEIVRRVVPSRPAWRSVVLASGV